MYEYRATVLRWVDGDTVDVDIDLGFGVWMRRQRVRLYGINTPESRTKDLKEKELGLAAKEFAKSQAPVGKEIYIRTKKDNETGKYGRILGEIMIDDEISLNKMLVESGHAVEYFGGKR
ncbi:nuclease [archaeon]|nr:nuclease [archaeon]